MSVNLKKGDSFPLSKEVPGLKKLMIGVGWELTVHELDLDVSIFMLGQDQKLINSNYFVYYNNLKSPDGAVHHTGDNKSGKGTDDDEAVLVNLEAVHKEVTDIVVVVSINEAAENEHHFGMLKEAYVRLYDEVSKKELTLYDLDAQHSGDTEVEFAKLHRSADGWTFTAVSNGSHKGLEALLEKYS